MGMMPRVAALEVEEGDRVQAGQLLASFDNRVDALADQAVAEATLTSLVQRRRILQADLARYRGLQVAGAVTTEGVEQRQLRLLEVEQELVKARAERQRQAVKLPFTELRAPFAGTVLQIHARSGERPGDKGVLELGRSDQMEAVVEVYESDINRVRVGQAVSMRSENGGFDGSLRGRVIRIEPSVRQRQVLSTDPSADTDARIVEVRVKLFAPDAARVQNLSGLKLIAKLQP
jgi:HlyD family secretion protein